MIIPTHLHEELLCPELCSIMQLVSRCYDLCGCSSRSSHKRDWILLTQQLNLPAHQANMSIWQNMGPEEV